MTAGGASPSMSMGASDGMKWSPPYLNGISILCNAERALLWYHIWVNSSQAAASWYDILHNIVVMVELLKI